jgi:hypothetical protein
MSVRSCIPDSATKQRDCSAQRGSRGDGLRRTTTQSATEMGEIAMATDGLHLPRVWDEPEVEIWILNDNIHFLGCGDAEDEFGDHDHWEFWVTSEFAGEIGVMMELGVDELQFRDTRVGLTRAADIHWREDDTVVVSFVDGSATRQFTVPRPDARRMGKALQFAADWADDSRMSGNAF